jgi:hypothetical protein
MRGGKRPVLADPIGSHRATKTDPLLHPRSISLRWALHPYGDVECRVLSVGHSRQKA